MKKEYPKTFKDFLIYEKQINEISSDLFKKAIDVSKERGTDNRTNKLGELYFDKFIGEDFLNGKIINITVFKPKQGRYTNVVIEYKIDDGKINKTKYVTYDVDKDSYDIEDVKIDRKDARILSKIALHINPESKYKETGKYFNIIGH